MITRAIKNNQDSSGRVWVFCRGYSAYKKEQKSIEQDIKSALLEFKNDCFWALQSGIDWLTRLGAKNQKELLDDDVQEVIQNRFGVISVQDFQSNVIERVYSCQCNVYTIFTQDSYLFTFSTSI